MEEFCSGNASAAASYFAEYVHHGSDAQYWQGVASFRSFMNAYHWVRDDGDYNYLECNILFNNLLYQKDLCTGYMEQIRRIMRLLGENMDDPNVYLEMDRLNNLIEYGP